MNAEDRHDAAQNPYAPPLAEPARVDEDASTLARRDGDCLVLPPGGQLPARCVICNSTSTTSRSERLVSRSRWIFVILLPLSVLAVVGAVLTASLLGVVVLVAAVILTVRLIVGSDVRQSPIHYSVCDWHGSATWLTKHLLWIGICCFATGIVALNQAMLGLGSGVVGLMLLAAGASSGVIRTGISFYSFQPRIVGRPTSDTSLVRVAGAGQAFLASLPAYQPSERG